MVDEAEQQVQPEKLVVRVDPDRLDQLVHLVLLVLSGSQDPLDRSVLRGIQVLSDQQGLVEPLEHLESLATLVRQAILDRKVYLDSRVQPEQMERWDLRGLRDSQDLRVS